MPMGWVAGGMLALRLLHCVMGGGLGSRHIQGPPGRSAQCKTPHSKPAPTLSPHPGWDGEGAATCMG